MKAKFDRNSYETPSWFFNALDREFNFSHDLCATRQSRKTISFFSKEQDSLSQDWFLLDGWLWINPPYSPLKPWLEKIQTEAKQGAKIVALVPPVICANYFQELRPQEIRFVVGRINFLADKKETTSNRQDSCLLIFDGEKEFKDTKVTWVTHDELLKGDL